MRHEFPWLWKVETRRLLWLLGLTFAIVVTFQYIELPYAISSLFSSSKIPISKHQNGVNLTPAMAPSFSLNNSTLTDSGGDEEEVEVDQIFDSSGNATSPAISPTFQPLNPSLLKENTTAPTPTPSAEPPAAFPTLSPPPVKENATAPAALPDLKPSLVEENATAPVASVKPPVALPGLSPPPVKENATMPTTPQVQEKIPTKIEFVRFVPEVKEKEKMPDSGVMSISEMSKQLRENRISHNRLAKKPKWVTKPDLELLQAKYEIENAPIDDKDPLLYAPLYRNVSTFKKSYELMEKMLKVYVYKEGNRPIMHSPILRGIYASEGWFMKVMESNGNRFVTKDAAKAHLFYLPFSSRMLEVTLYVQDSHSHKNLIKYLKDYIDLISAKYPFWNRTSGADHVLAACHDWVLSASLCHKNLLCHL